MSLTVEFQNDGRVRISRYDNGEMFSVTTDANKLQALMPGPYFEQLRAAVGALHELTGDNVRRIGV